MVFILVADWIACHLLFKNRREVLFVGLVEVEADHIGTRHHNFADVALGEVKDVIDEINFRIVDESLLAAFLHEQTNFLWIVRDLAFRYA